MKKLLLSLALLPTVAFAQETVEADGIESADNVYVYAEIIGVDKNIGSIDNNIDVQINFGDKKNPWGDQGRIDIVNEKGKKVKFKSMVDALNYLGRKGWVLESTYVIPREERNTYHWIVSKSVDPDEQDAAAEANKATKKKRKLLPW